MVVENDDDNWYSLHEFLLYSTEEDRKRIIDETRKLKMAMRKEWHREQNRNYHMDMNKPTEMIYYLNWNKNIHKRGIIINAITIPLLTAATITGIPFAIPFLIEELASTSEEGWTDININDFLWFERDTIAQHLGYSDWDEYEYGNKEEEDEEE